MAFMKRSLGALVLAACAAAAPACSSTGESDSSTATRGADDEAMTGTVGFNLVINGETINAVQLTVSGPLLPAPINKTINTSSSQATVSAFVGALPAGTGYQAVLAATTASGAPCNGSAAFDVLAGQTVGVSIQLLCDNQADPTPRGNAIINGEVITEAACPVLTEVIVAPLQTELNGLIDVSAKSSIPGTFAWTSSGGSFANPAAAITTYNCSSAGTQTVTITVTGVLPPGTVGDCEDSITTEVNCVPIGPFCGDGTLNQPSEECEPPGTATCNAQCQTISCGDGVVETGEECDPPAAGTCTSTCQSIVCGDGVVDAPETCEPPGTASCDANCQAIVDNCTPCLNASCAGPLADEAARCTGTTCDAYQACVESSNCADVDVRTCYCGSVAFTQCFDVFASPSTPQGPCKAQIETLTGLTSPLQIGTLYFDASTPLGATNQLLLCTNNNCSGVCN